MTENVGFDAAGAAAEVPETSTTDAGDSFNPAWNPLLEKLPTEFHSMIAPTLREWDTGVQKRFTDVQSKYEPYKQFVEQSVDPEQIQVSLQVAQMLRDNPRFVYDKMMEQYGEEWGVTGQGVVEEQDTFEEGEEPVYSFENDPAFQQTQAQVQALAQFQQAQIEQQARQEINQQIEKEFADVSTKYGELNQQEINMIVSVATAQNLTVPQAAEQVFAFAPRQAAAPATSLPNIVPPGGGVPAQIQNPASLDSKGTRALVEGILRNAANSKD